MIRSAMQSDIPNMVMLFEAQHKAMGCDWTLDRPRLAATFVQAVAQPQDFLCLTGERSLLLAACFDSPVGAGKVAVEMGLCAKHGDLDAIVERYESWARSKQCRAVSLACDQRFSTFERLYRRYGYAPAEMTFSKVL
jgi:hypothetical protein